ncbi:MAG TPA: hypothetical protein VLF71_02685 [Candidatus Saccharimonadales bacterium]|nr:hypothetical protein [Candidatus Saccharimonadales bacterium]
MADDAQADGYYAEDEMGDDELDLSFLDDKDDDHAEPEAPQTPQK